MKIRNFTWGNGVAFKKSKLFGTAGILVGCIAGWAFWLSPAENQSGVPINDDLPESTEAAEAFASPEPRDLDLMVGQEAVLSDGIEVFDDFSDSPLEKSKNQKSHFDF